MSASTKQSSSWISNNVTTPEVHQGKNAMLTDGLSRQQVFSEPGVGRDYVATLSDISSELLQDGGFRNVSAWDKDIATSLTEEKYMEHMNGKSRFLEPLRAAAILEFQTSESGASLSVMLNSGHSSLTSESYSSNLTASTLEGMETNLSVSGNKSREHADFDLDKFSHKYTDDDGWISNLCSGISSVTINESQVVDHPNLIECIGSASNVCLTGIPENSDSSLQHDLSCNRAGGLEPGAVASFSELSSRCASREICENQVYLTTGNEFKPPVSAVNAQSHIHSDVKNESTCSSYSNHLTSHRGDLSNCSLNDGIRYTDTFVSGDSWLPNADKTLLPQGEESMLLTKRDSLSNCHKPEKIVELSETYFTDENVRTVGTVDNDYSGVDMGEKGIVSDILNFDPWDNSLSSANLLARLLGKTSKNNSAPLLSNIVESPNCNHSNFPFARQENQLNLFDSSSLRLFPSVQNSCGNGFQNGPQVNNFQGLNAVINNTGFSSDKNAGE